MKLKATLQALPGDGGLEQERAAPPPQEDAKKAS
jgi:hypothetical protein